MCVYLWVHIYKILYEQYLYINMIFKNIFNIYLYLCICTWYLIATQNLVDIDMALCWIVKMTSHQNQSLTTIPLLGDDFFSKIPWGSWYVHLYSWKITLVYVTTTILPYTFSLFHPHFCRCQTPYTIHLGYIFVVMPTWGNDSCWTNIFQLVWNHKLANYWTK